MMVAVGSPLQAGSLPSQASLAAYCPFLLPDEETELLSSQALDAIASLAETLPPVPRIALEFRLGPDATQVDLQQQFLRGHGAFPQLVQYLGSPSFSVYAGFGRLASALEDDGGVLLRHVDEVFLEFDLPVGAGQSIPSIFISLPEDQSLASEIACEVIGLLGGPDEAKLKPAVARCISACSGEEVVAGLGFMLGRSSGSVRINVKRLLPSTAVRYLETIGYTGNCHAAGQHFQATLHRTDRVTLALDLLIQEDVARIVPRIGLECYFDEQPTDDLLWAMTLGELCSEGLCGPARSNALLALPGQTRPSSTPGAWPLDLIMQSTAQPEHHFSVFLRALYHIKLSGEPGGQWEAKAYLGASHEWITPTAKDVLAAPTALPRKAPGHAVSASDGTASALERGTRFLLRRQLQSGLWRDFKTSSISDEWVSAFIACHLLDTGLDPARGAAEECAEMLLRTQRSDGGWGYWVHQAPDADSTAWVLRLLQRVGLQDKRAFAHGMEFLQRHALSNGGVCTYADHARLAAKLGAEPDESFAGWEQAHVCVTGAAAPLLGDAALAFLSDRQQDGHWSGYWWHGDAYSTAMAVSALAGTTRYAAAVDAAQRWAADGVRLAESSAEKNAFEIAFCVKILCESHPDRYPQEIANATRLLLDLQIGEGWPPSARMRIPLPATLVCHGDEGVHLDYRGNFTTAAVVSALAASQRALSPWENAQ